MLKLIDFYSNWCPPCKIMESIFEELKGEFKGRIEFEKINVEETQEKAIKYGILDIPTFVIEKDGKELDRKIGAMSKGGFREWIEEYL